MICALIFGVPFLFLGIVIITVTVPCGEVCQLTKVAYNEDILYEKGIFKT